MQNPYCEHLQNETWKISEIVMASRNGLFFLDVLSFQGSLPAVVNTAESSELPLATNLPHICRLDLTMCSGSDLVDLRCLSRRAEHRSLFASPW